MSDKGYGSGYPGTQHASVKDNLEMLKSRGFPVSLNVEETPTDLMIVGYREIAGGFSVTTEKRAKDGKGRYNPIEGTRRTVHVDSTQMIAFKDNLYLL